MILAMGVFYGGVAQIIVGVMEWKKGNTFGTTAFTSHGSFWLSFVGIFTFPAMGLCEKASGTGIIAYLIMWGIFTAVVFVGTLPTNRALQFVFGSLAVLFFLLAAGDYTGSAALKTFTGWAGVVCGASAIYAALAQVLNESLGKTVLPLGAVK